MANFLKTNGFGAGFEPPPAASRSDDKVNVCIVGTAVVVVVAAVAYSSISSNILKTNNLETLLREKLFIIC